AVWPTPPRCPGGPGDRLTRLARNGNARLLTDLTAHDARHEVHGPLLGLLVDAADVLADHAEEEELHAAEEGDEQDQRGEADRGAMQDDPGVQRVEREAAGDDDRDEAEHGGRAQGDDGEGEDAVRRELQQLERTVAGAAGESLVALDDEPHLAEADPA